MSMQASGYYKLQARVSELRAEIDDIRKDGRKLRKLGLDITRLEAAVVGLEANARELSDVVRTSESEVMSLIRASRGDEG